MRAPRTRLVQESGYTLIEILASFFLMTIILALVAGVFAENGRQRSASLGRMRESLSAVGVLDQLAADLESALILTSPPYQQPDENPWRFLAEDSGDVGARAVRFTTQNAPSSSGADHTSGWIEVAYFLEEDASGEEVLWRWTSPRPPSDADRNFPNPDDPGAARIAVGVRAFGLRFTDALGTSTDEWDSAFQPAEAPLPVSAEINLTLSREARLGETNDDSNSVAGPPHLRRVAIHTPPIDFIALLELGQDDDDDNDCFTVADCQAKGSAAWFQEEIQDDCGGDDRLCDLLSNAAETCWSTIETSHPALADRAPPSCSTP